MVDPRFREIYFQFYKETYRPSVLDRKTKELVAIAASLAAKCQGCLEGHIKKALKFGATREEISETIAIAIGRQRRGHRRPHGHRRRQPRHQALLVAVEALQERYAPGSICFGCGPANEQGPAHPQLRRGRRARRGRGTPEPPPRGVPRHAQRRDHRARCSTATATGRRRTTSCRAAGASAPPCTVTADFAVKLQAADADRRAGARSARGWSSRPTIARSSRRRSRSGGKVTRDLPRDVRGGEAGPPRVPPLVDGNSFQERVPSPRSRPRPAFPHRMVSDVRTSSSSSGMRPPARSRVERARRPNVGASAEPCVPARGTERGA